mmetsp:Transcript_22098/g.71507  ORF Transcript_22098/g.71507 Transcript_22098/m.71507 type:complete len:211 (-) Transcript_22098:96-728(-)
MVFIVGAKSVHHHVRRVVTSSMLQTLSRGTLARGRHAVKQRLRGREASAAMDPQEATTNEEDQQAARNMRRRAERSGEEADAKMEAMEALSDEDTLPSCSIDVGRFKYVLFRVDLPNGESRHLVRGVAGAAYHRDAAESTANLLDYLGARYRILGGGRIEHDAAARRVLIYGHSMGFPWANGVFQHEVSAEVVRVALGQEYVIETSDDGY